MHYLSKEADMPKRTQGPSGSTKTGKTNMSADAIALLKQDHRKVEELFEQFLQGDTGGQSDLAQQIFKELEVHAALEEELFYPALQDQGDMGELGELEQGDSDIDGADTVDQGELEEDEDDEDVEETSEEIGEDVIASAYEDHQTVKELIQRLKNLDPGSADFRQGMTELQEMVIDHVAEEEEILFAEAELKLDTKTLGLQLQERKQDLLSSTAV
jgi:hemerythrin superfamily protein